MTTLAPVGYTSLVEAEQAWLLPAAEHGESCTAILGGEPCDREAAFIVFWTGDFRLPQALRCGCARSTYCCLPCGEKAMALRSLEVEPGGSSTWQCVKCDLYMLPTRTERIPR